jgi:hypothetical protein
MLRIMRKDHPARSYLVGREKWHVRLSRFLPLTAVEALVSRRFHLAN